MSIVNAPLRSRDCPRCGAAAVSAAWHLTDLLSRRASVDLACASCRAAHTLSLILPCEAMPFYPIQRMEMLQRVIENQTKAIADRIRLHADTMPVAAFTTSPVWEHAKWRGTTFRWDPNHSMKVPPIMGLCFENADAGRKLFGQLVTYQGNQDKHEEVRVSIVQGSPPGQQFGYSVHICPDPESLAAYATVAGIVLDPKLIRFFGRWNRFYPVPGLSSPPLLEMFERGVEKHGEFMLTSATRRNDGLEYLDVQVGLIKHKVEFRKLTDITDEDDLDAMALLMPLLVPPVQF